MHRLAVAAAWSATVLSLSGCMTYENITDVYAEESPDAGAVTGGPQGGPARPPSTSTAGSGGEAGIGGTGGSGGEGGSGGTAGDAMAMQSGQPDAMMTGPASDGPPALSADAPSSTMNLAVGLISRYKLDEGQGTTTQDTANSANTATITNAVWDPAGFPAAKYTNPGCLRFDGTTAFVSIGISNMPANGQAQTVSLWINPTSFPANANRVALSLTQGQDGPSRLKVGLRAGRFTAWKSAGALVQGPAGATGWHHLAYTFDGTTHRLFLDGTMQAMSVVAPDRGAVVQGRIGSNFDATEKFAGQIDEVRIYNRALSPEEVTGLASGYE